MLIKCAKCKDVIYDFDSIDGYCLTCFGNSPEMISAQQVCEEINTITADLKREKEAMNIKCKKCNTDMVGPYCPNCLKEKKITKDDDLFQMPDMDDIKAIREWKTALSKLRIRMRYSIDDVKLQYFIDDASKSIDLLDDEIRHLQKKRSILAEGRERARQEMEDRKKEKAGKK